MGPGVNAHMEQAPRDLALTTAHTAGLREEGGASWGHQAGGLDSLPVGISLSKNKTEPLIF